MPSARLRTITRLGNIMYIQRISAVTMKIAFRTLSEQADDRALVDSGATENFIDYETWKQMGVGK